MKKIKRISCFGLRPVLVGWLAVSLLVLLSAQGPRVLPLEQVLRKNRDRKRLVLVVASTAEQADFKRQKALLVANSAGLRERDMVVVEVFYTQLPPAEQAFLARKIDGRPEFALVLIGKDGGVKVKSVQPIGAARLFETVDNMPMRRQEMRRRATN